MGGYKFMFIFNFYPGIEATTTHHSQPEKFRHTSETDINSFQTSKYRP